jgi:hypothetical protein
MARTLPLDAREPRYRIAVDLDDVQVGVVAYWLGRAAAWYLDIQTPEGADIATGIRVTPGAVLAMPAAGAGLPPGKLVAVGADAYSYDDLGTAVQVLYLTEAEVETVST